nr:hypothetical protein Q903MT_gene4467 [Picea sitchensis]
MFCFTLKRSFKGDKSFNRVMKVRFSRAKSAFPGIFAFDLQPVLEAAVRGFIRRFVSNREVPVR